MKMPKFTRLFEREPVAKKERIEPTFSKAILANHTEHSVDWISQTLEHLKQEHAMLLDDIVILKEKMAQQTKMAQPSQGLTNAVNAEETALTAEIGAEAARISARRKLIPIHYEYLFKDWLVLIAGDEELEPIIQQRIADEEKREAELKAKAEQEALAKAEAEKVKAEAKAVADEMEQQAVENPQEIAKTEPTEPLEDFVITIRLNQTTQAQAVATARGLKAQFGDYVSLNKATPKLKTGAAECP